MASRPGLGVPLQDQRITRALLVPPILLALATHPLVASYDLSALELIGSGAAPLDPGLERACAEVRGAAARSQALAQVRSR